MYFEFDFSLCGILTLTWSHPWLCCLDEVLCLPFFEGLLLCLQCCRVTRSSHELYRMVLLAKSLVKEGSQAAKSFINVEARPENQSLWQNWPDWNVCWPWAIDDDCPLMFMGKQRMVHLIKGLADVHYCDIRLVAPFPSGCQLIDEFQNLCFAGLLLPESMLLFSTRFCLHRGGSSCGTL